MLAFQQVYVGVACQLTYYVWTFFILLLCKYPFLLSFPFLSFPLLFSNAQVAPPPFPLLLPVVLVTQHHAWGTMACYVGRNVEGISRGDLEAQS